MTDKDRLYPIVVFNYTETVQSNRSSAPIMTRSTHTKSKLVSVRFNIVIHLLLVFWREKK
jgi:hypothetical protein